MAELSPEIRASDSRPSKVSIPSVSSCGWDHTQDDVCVCVCRGCVSTPSCPLADRLCSPKLKLLAADPKHKYAFTSGKPDFQVTRLFGIRLHTCEIPSACSHLVCVAAESQRPTVETTKVQTSSAAIQANVHHLIRLFTEINTICKHQHT